MKISFNNLRGKKEKVSFPNQMKKVQKIVKNRQNKQKIIQEVQNKTKIL